MKKAGVQFAILKVTQKNNTVESAFEKNYKGCIDQGILVGVYRYVYAKTVAAATAEAKAIVSVLKGKKIPCGVWLDMEDSSIRGIGKSALNAVIAAERQVLEAAGYQVGIYCNQNWYNSVLDVVKAGPALLDCQVRHQQRQAAGKAGGQEQAHPLGLAVFQCGQGVRYLRECGCQRGLSGSGRHC